jgi:hypothetical protein
MSYNPKQFKALVTKILKAVPMENFYSEAAVYLLLGTAAQESTFGTYLRQITGPARGCFQMEGATFNWLKEKYKGLMPELAQWDADDMEWNLALAIIMCRLKYMSCPGALPTELVGWAAYWKKYYNTPLGAGTEMEFIRNFKRFVTV